MQICTLLSSRNAHAVVSQHENRRESERDTHTAGTTEVPSTYMSGRKQYPQPVVPGLNYVTPLISDHYSIALSSVVSLIRK